MTKMQKRCYKSKSGKELCAGSLIKELSVPSVLGQGKDNDTEWHKYKVDGADPVTPTEEIPGK